MGDELHAVLAALTSPLPDILYTYRNSDNCLPLSGLYRWWIDGGRPLTEMGLRLPVVASALAFLALAPRIADGWVGRRAAAVFAWLLALSPALVLYSRIVRSYMPIVLLGLLAAAAFFTWWRTGRRSWAVAYALAAALAVYFHLLAAPFAAAPLAFAAAARLAGRGRGRPGWGSLTAVGAGAALGVLTFVIPARESLQALVADKGGYPTLPVERLPEVLGMAAGGPPGLLTAVFFAAALAGLVRLLRRHGELGLYTLTLVLVQLAATVVLAPVGSPNPWIFFRYQLIALPLVLLWVAVGLAAPGEVRAEARAERPGRGLPGRRLAAAVPALVLAALAVGGPLARAEYLVYGSFVHRRNFLAYAGPLPTVAETPVLDVYRELAAAPGEGAVLEVPWLWPRTRVFPIYQHLHRRDVLVSDGWEIFDDPRLAFTHLIPMRPDAWLASGARFLVLHRRLPWEEDRIVFPAGAQWRRGWRLAEAQRRRLVRLGSRLARRLEAEWGPPLRADRRLWVWDLAAVRRAQLASQPM
jgi:hypothetical protein